MVTTDLGRAAIIDQAAATSADLAVPKCKIWTARLRIDHVAIFQASDSRVFNAVALIDLAAEEDSAVIASAGEAALIDLVAEEDLVALIASVVEDSAVVAAAGSGVDDDN
jgi:hypothetical protein